MPLQWCNDFWQRLKAETEGKCQKARLGVCGNGRRSPVARGREPVWPSGKAGK